MNSEDARIAALQIFDEIFPISFAALDGVIEHEYARENRYTARDIEMEFAAKLGQLRESGDHVKIKMLLCEVCGENKPYTEGKWGKYIGIWVCNSCREENKPNDGEDEEVWFDDDGTEEEDEGEQI